MFKKIFNRWLTNRNEKHIIQILSKNPILENKILAQLIQKKLPRDDYKDTNWIRDSDYFIISTQTFFKELHNYYISLSDQPKYHKLHYLEEIFFYVGRIEYWCEENCAGQWGIAHNEKEYTFYFQDRIDAMAFKLRWL